MSHTPGPWTIDSKFASYQEPFDIYANGISIAVIRRCNYMDDADVEPDANARLIAAAPTMLEALKHMVSLIHTMDTVYSNRGAKFLLQTDTVKNAMAAIKLAEEGQ